MQPELINQLYIQPPSLGMGDESGAVQNARLGYTAPTFGGAIFNQPPMTTVSGGVNSFPNAGVGFSTGTINQPGSIPEINQPGSIFNPPPNQPAPVQPMPSPVQPQMQPTAQPAMQPSFQMPNMQFQRPPMFGGFNPFGGFGSPFGGFNPFGGFGGYGSPFMGFGAYGGFSGFNPFGGFNQQRQMQPYGQQLTQQRFTGY